MKTLEEFKIRLKVLEQSLSILSDGKARKIKELVQLLTQQGYRILENQLLDIFTTEGKNYLIFNYSDYTFKLREISTNKISVRGISLRKVNGSLKLDAQVVNNKQDYTFEEGTIDSAAFFTVMHQGKDVRIRFNEDHPIYPFITDVFSKVSQNGLENARNVIRYILIAWAKFELSINYKRRHNIQEFRHDWGREVRILMQPDCDNE